MINRAEGVVRRRLPSGDLHERALRGRQIYCVAPNVEHSARWDREDEALEIYSEPKFLKSLPREKVAALFERESLPEASDDGVIWEHVGAIALACADRLPDSAHITEIAALLVKRLVAAHAVPTCKNVTPELSPMHRSKFDEYIRGNISKSFGVLELAQAVALSQSHLTVLCRNTYGRTPMEYVLKLRLEKAHAMALAGNTLAKEIAPLCGLFDTSHLNREFRKRYKKTIGVVIKRTRSLYYPSES